MPDKKLLGLSPENWASLAGNTGDAVTTGIALAKGGVEKGPYPQNITANLAMQAGQEVLRQLLINKLRNSGHENWAKVIGYGSGAWGAHSTIHNIKSIGEMNK